MPDFSPLHCTPLHRFNLSEGTSAAGTEQVTNVATKHMGRYYLRYAAHSFFFDRRCRLSTNHLYAYGVRSSINWELPPTTL